MVPEGRPLIGPDELPEPPDPWWARRVKLIPRNDAGADLSPDDVPDVPQCIAHRGYKSRFPENTMLAFRAAAAVGTHAIETDLHLTRDGVVVLSHDRDLKRCFGVNKNIRDCDWEYVSSLRSLKEPHEPMPRLAELLDFLTEDPVNQMWLMLDIKQHDDAEELIRRTATTIASCPPRNGRPWHERIILCCWTKAYINLCRELVPNFALAHTGFSTLLARPFLGVSHVCFNMMQKVLPGPFGTRFMRQTLARDRRIFAWPVNDERWMRWCVTAPAGLGAIDGVITDNPELFLDVCAATIGEHLATTTAATAAAAAATETETEMGRKSRRRMEMGTTGKKRRSSTTNSTTSTPSDRVQQREELVARLTTRRTAEKDVGFVADLLLWNVGAAVLATLFFLSGWYRRKATRRETQRLLLSSR